MLLFGAYLWWSTSMSVYIYVCAIIHDLIWNTHKYLCSIDKLSNYEQCLNVRFMNICISMLTCRSKIYAFTFPGPRRRLDSSNLQCFSLSHLFYCPYHRCEWLFDPTLFGICLVHFVAGFVPRMEILYKNLWN